LVFLNMRNIYSEPTSLLVLSLLLCSYTAFAFTQAEITVALASTTCASPKRIITNAEGNQKNSELCPLLPSTAGHYQYASSNGMAYYITKASTGTSTCDLTIGAPNNGLPVRGAICYQECGGACSAGQSCQNSTCVSRCGNAATTGQTWDSSTSACVCNYYNGFKKRGVDGINCYDSCYGAFMISDSDRTTVAQCRCVSGATAGTDSKGYHECRCAGGSFQSISGQCVSSCGSLQSYDTYSNGVNQCKCGQNAESNGSDGCTCRSGYVPASDQTSCVTPTNTSTSTPSVSNPSSNTTITPTPSSNNNTNTGSGNNSNNQTVSSDGVVLSFSSFALVLTGMLVSLTF